jgi:hypothetical protein
METPDKMKLNFAKNIAGDSLVNISGVSGSAKFILKAEVIERLRHEIEMKLALREVEELSELEKFALLILHNSY